MSRRTQLLLVLAIAFALYWPLRGAKLAYSSTDSLAISSSLVVPMATITYRLPAQTFRDSLRLLCEKVRCEGDTDEAKVRWASDWLVQLASTWDWKDLGSLDATVTVEVEE